MENENKDKNVILTDEELKEVAGGVKFINGASVAVAKKDCPKNQAMIKCVAYTMCAWIDNHCVEHPKYYL